MSKFLEILFLILFSSVKFTLVPPLAILKYKYSAFDSILFTTVGGTIGVLVFYFLSKELLIAWQFIRLLFIAKHKRHKHKHHKHHHPSPIFTSFSRKIVRLKQRWGYYSLIIITPCVLSIPVGSFIAARFYPGKQSIILLCCSVFAWSLIINISIEVVQSYF